MLKRLFNNALPEWKQVYNARKTACDTLIADAERDDETAFLSGIPQLTSQGSYHPELIKDIFQRLIEINKPNLFIALFRHFGNFDPNKNFNFRSVGYSSPRDVPMLCYALEKGVEPIALFLLDQPGIDIQEGGEKRVYYSGCSRSEKLPSPMELAQKRNMLRAIAKLGDMLAAHYGQIATHAKNEIKAREADYQNRVNLGLITPVAQPS